MAFTGEFPVIEQKKTEEVRISAPVEVKADRELSMQELEQIVAGGAPSNPVRRGGLSINGWKQ
ncbi:hypothetical protein [Tuwongella immobilis]|uniref:Uncharacterized protein n=1 Tax=Tuwongella immobilis TaxID=692036 RepID=A0A6C2YU68_9BACT|nr:hypothetical protein [Tuwongella immobilis]VIP04589.1 unnamed protein product [Tuwongella immobilis]VTS06539.1 unnamed protein product [Tuwongella immobilis]